jgi:hypothetical protein
MKLQPRSCCRSTLTNLKATNVLSKNDTPTFAPFAELKHTGKSYLNSRLNFPVL